MIKNKNARSKKTRFIRVANFVYRNMYLWSLYRLLYIVYLSFVFKIGIDTDL